MNIRRVPDIDPALKEYPRHHEEAAAEEDFEDGVVTAGGDRRRRTSSRNSTNSRPQLRSVIITHELSCVVAHFSSMCFASKVEIIRKVMKFQLQL